MKRVKYRIKVDWTRYGVRVRNQVTFRERHYAQTCFNIWSKNFPGHVEFQRLARSIGSIWVITHSKKG